MKKSHLFALLLLTSSFAPNAYAFGELTTEEFVTKASVSNLFEIESSKLALEKATDPKVKAVAQQMITDHTKAGENLKAAVQEAKLPSALIATALDDKHLEKMADLREETGEDFDEEYIDQQEDAHDKAVKLFKKYSEDGESL